MNKTIPVTLPDYVWGRLATVAEHRKCSIAALLASSIQKILEDDPMRLDELQMELKKHNQTVRANNQTRKAA